MADTRPCAHCEAAQLAPNWPGYTATCHGCKVRALASGPAFFESARSGAMTAEYRAGLQAIFGDHWRIAHEEVKTEHARIKALQSTTKGG